MRLVNALTLSALVLAGGASAKDKVERAPVLQSVLDCRGKTGDAERLACFDTAVGRLGEADAKDEVVVVDRETVRTARRQAFGFSLPNFALFRGGGDKEQVEQLDGVAAAARRDGSGHWVVTLEDGSVWGQTDGKPIPISPKPGSKITIKTASFGSFFMRVNGQPGVRATRQR